jgi:glycine betaine/proline transport system substrate-binding protein
MKLPKPRTALAVTVALSAVLGLASCSSDEGGAKTITIGTLAWEESLAVTAVWQNLLEDQGYEVEVKQLDAGPAYQALSTGQIDLFPEQWPNYFGEFMEKYKEDIATVGTWYEGTDINLAVPNYVDEVDSLTDLAEHADLFDDRIVGIEPGSETMKVLESTVVPGYGLDGFKVESSSTPAMLASLEDAIAEEKPIVVTLWRPHWAFAKYPIKALEDPDELFGGVGVIQTASTKGFGDDHPEAADFLSRFSLTSDQLGELELTIQEEGDPDKGAAKWLEANQDLVDEWSS